MRWDRFFEDLQDQFDAEWEAERAVLDTEAERLRLSKVALRDRVGELGRGGGGDSPFLAWDLVGGASISARVSVVGADWVGVVTDAGRSGVIPLAAITAIGLPHADLLRSARARPPERASLTERMTIGFALRDLVRRRTPVTVSTVGGRALTGTIDRAGADHLDLALHDPGEPRRATAVQGHRLIPFSALAWVRIDSHDRL
ncbi:MAG: hypothetical protein K0R60_647 [Microbacterium sp.]|nr:hypothetical protein [Microbacterium sp.]